MGFDAGTLQMISTVGSAVGAVTGAVGSLTSGRANADAATYQAAVARNNQVVADQNAQYALEAGRRSEEAQRQKTAQLIGAQRAQMAANGIDVNSGSPLNLQASSAQVGELDALTIRNNALRQAINFQRQGADFGANAGMLDKQASNARKAGGIGAFSSLVGGAASVSDKWNKYRTPAPTSAGLSDLDWGFN